MISNQRPPEKLPKPNDPGSPQPYTEPTEGTGEVPPEIPSPIQPTRIIPPSAWGSGSERPQPNNPIIDPFEAPGEGAPFEPPDSYPLDPSRDDPPVDDDDGFLARRPR